jgi:hypothetical protein
VQPPPTYIFAVGQRVRSCGPHHAGEVGAVISCHPAFERPAYVVEFAGCCCVYLGQEQLKLPGTEGWRDGRSGQRPQVRPEIPAPGRGAADLGPVPAGDRPPVGEV